MCEIGKVGRFFRRLKVPRYFHFLRRYNTRRKSSSGALFSSVGFCWEKFRVTFCDFNSPVFSEIHFTETSAMFAAGWNSSQTAGKCAVSLCRATEHRKDGYSRLYRVSIRFARCSRIASVLCNGIATISRIAVLSDSLLILWNSYFIIARACGANVT